MDDTAVNLNQNQKERFVQGELNGNPTEPWLFTDATAGAGSLKSSVHDQLLFLKANLNPPQFLKDAIKATHEIVSHSPKWSMGWGVVELIPKNKIYFHNGMTYGSTSHLSFDRRSNVGVVILTNNLFIDETVPDSRIQDLGFKILREAGNNN